MYEEHDTKNIVVESPDCHGLLMSDCGSPNAGTTTYSVTLGKPLDI